MTLIDIHEFCKEQRELLQLELQSEDEPSSFSSNSNHHHPKNSPSQDERKANSVLHQLEVEDISVGLYGRTVVQLKKISSSSSSVRSSNTLLPAHRFTTGDEVEIRNGTSTSRSTTSSTATKTISGVISQVTDETISVALFDTPQSKKKSNNTNKKEEEDGQKNNDDVLGIPPLSLLPKSSIEVHKKLMKALDELDKHGMNHPIAGNVIRTVFSSSSSPNESLLSCQTSSNKTTKPSSYHSTVSLEPININLDHSQQEAVQMALHQTVALLHGPPGSGKTTTVVELIRQAVHKNKYRVLVTAPSNVAVDNILSRLVSDCTNNNSNKNNKKKDKSNKQYQSKQLSLPPIKVVRLGHPARLQADILPYSLEAQVQAADGTEIVQDVRQELQTWLRFIHHPKTRYSDQITARREMKRLRQEIKQREQKVVQNLLQQAQVVLATCVGAANRLLLTSSGIVEKPFDLVIIDEAAQSLETACWIPTLLGTRLVLAGDHCQLPPTIKCNDPRVQKGLGYTMFARIMKLYEHNEAHISRMLKVQYRMHETISDWASAALYHGELKTHESAQGRTLATLSGVSTESERNLDVDLVHIPLLLIDTAGCDCYEGTNAAGSRFNEGEAQIVQQHVQKLLDMGVPASQIAVITPYNGQVELLKSMGMPVEVRTVDGFQGGEREAVVLSLVRSSPQKGSIGFLRDDRRLNVAVTRAKRHCCVVADSETVSLSPFVKNLIEWIEQHGEQRSALEYMDETTHTQVDQDLIQAQWELQKYSLNGTAEVKDKEKTSLHNKYYDLKKSNDNQTNSDARDALLNNIRTFQQTGKPGDTLALSPKLTKGDRHAVHELAEELGLLHVSSGTEGHNRRMTVSIPLLETTQREDEDLNAITDDVSEIPNTTTNVKHDEPHEVESSSSVAFHVLQDNDEESSVSTDEQQPEAVVISSPSTNHILTSLAKEREQRERDRKKQQSHSSTTGTNKPKNKDPKKGKKVGGISRPKPKNDHDDKLDDIEDDMAFLDAQIDKVQNSHGRTVIGKGSNYRTVINGILLGKPAPVEKKKDPRATSALQAKLKQAENNRKAKSKPKKK